ncbi:hypothetical protein, partial [Pantoea agglomerans]|uniref:hypothetical protein n=1 Tax=Enterobacter agglomerans TaxID=549 RepID=UPI0020BF58C5
MERILVCGVGVREEGGLGAVERAKKCRLDNRQKNRSIEAIMMMEEDFKALRATRFAVWCALSPCSP